jgi:hypothetical protein
MDTRSNSEASFPIAWPLAASLLLTTSVVAVACTPRQLNSWRQLFTLATAYLLVAGCVHALAVWGVCRVRTDDETIAEKRIWPVIWAAWVAIVWLPLIALLTREESPWVALVLPVTAIFAAFLSARGAKRREWDDEVAIYEPPAPILSLHESPPLWRVLSPAIFTAVSAQVGLAVLAGGHAWTGGCLLGASAMYPVRRWQDRQAITAGRDGGRLWGRTSAGNSILVWLLIALALIPLLAAYAGGELSGILGIRPPMARVFAPPSLVHRSPGGYNGVILLTPSKPHELIAPAKLSASVVPATPHMIEFDGVYWYFKEPATQPDRGARVTQGDPAKNRIFSTDSQPLVMEAHQHLGHSVLLSGSRSLRVDVTNADNVPGTISLEVLLRDTSSKKIPAMSLGTVVLQSSTVSPMPLHRAPVSDKVIFQIPHVAAGRVFNEVTVRIKPDFKRSLAGAQVAIRDFVLQP